MCNFYDEQKFYVIVPRSYFWNRKYERNRGYSAEEKVLVALSVNGFYFLFFKKSSKTSFEKEKKEKTTKKVTNLRDSLEDQLELRNIMLYEKNR